MRLNTFSFILSFALAASPLAQGQSLTSDAGGMPLCMAANFPNSFISFEWNKDVFERRLFAVLNNGDMNTDPQCAQGSMRHFSDQTVGDKTHVELLSTSTPVFGVNLNDTLKTALNQVQLGANILRPQPELTAVGYLKDHPILDFTVKINRDLVKMYGLGFTSEIYKTWLEQKPANKAFKAQVLEYIHDEKSGGVENGKIASLPARFKNYTVVINYGFGYTMDDNRRFKPLQEDLEAFGLDVQVLQTDPFGDDEANSESIRNQLSGLVAQGRNLIVVSGSKGSTEAMGAVSDLADAQGPGRIAAVINLAGIVQGSYLVDWVTENLRWIFAKPKLYKQFNEHGAELTNSKAVDSLKSMTTKYVASFYGTHPIARNKNPIYVSFVGVTTGNGLAQDASLRDLQDEVVRAEMVTGFGANDGYVEYPGTTVPDNLGLQTYALAFDASHVILDGSFQGFSMVEKLTRQLVLRGILQSLADLLQIQVRYFRVSELNQFSSY